MRIWDIPTNKLCHNHLLGEHRELHALWSILVNKKEGYANHPETLRWQGKLKALYLRHEQQVKEMKQRGYNHNSPLDESLTYGEETQKEFINTIDEQIKILKDKGCKCKI